LMKLCHGLKDFGQTFKLSINKIWYKI
jgi:hypothetical protein